MTPLSILIYQLCAIELQFLHNNKCVINYTIPLVQYVFNILELPSASAVRYTGFSFVFSNQKFLGCESTSFSIEKI